jgi:hypothetical protein
MKLEIAWKEMCHLKAIVVSNVRVMQQERACRQLQQKAVQLQKSIDTAKRELDITFSSNSSNMNQILSSTVISNSNSSTTTTISNRSSSSKATMSPVGSSVPHTFSSRVVARQFRSGVKSVSPVPHTSAGESQALGCTAAPASCLSTLHVS